MYSQFSDKKKLLAVRLPTCLEIWTWRYFFKQNNILKENMWGTIFIRNRLVLKKPFLKYIGVALEEEKNTCFYHVRVISYFDLMTYRYIKAICNRFVKKRRFLTRFHLFTTTLNYNTCVCVYITGKLRAATEILMKTPNHPSDLGILYATPRS